MVSVYIAYYGYPQNNLEPILNCHQTSSLLIFTEEYNLVIKGTGEVIKCPFYMGRIQGALEFN